MLHVLIHMERHAGRATSETIANMLGTNPVVVRRTMAGLRDQGYVRSEKGHGGGWVLGRPLSEVTLLDVHRALGMPSPFALEVSSDHPKCLVEQAVNAALSDAFREAEAQLLARFAGVTLADLAADFDARMAALTSPCVATAEPARPARPTRGATRGVTPTKSKAAGRRPRS